MKRLLGAEMFIALVAIFSGGCVGVSPLTKKPALSAVLQSDTIQVGALNRSYSFYVPQNLPANAPLVFVLHGSMQTAQEIRVSTGYGFERLADENGFVVVYPNGYGRHWNDCRKEASYSARAKSVDDKSFFLALIKHFYSNSGIDRTRVFAMGYSNGGHMAYRLAYELPDHVAAIAAVAANLPADENCDCERSGKPIAVMILNGTADPINPYNGGHVTLFGFGNRGKVISAHASAEYFAQLDGQSNMPDISRVKSVEKADWHDAGKPEVLLETVHGGGHVVPQSSYRAPLYLGKTTHDIDGPREIWDFFARQQPLNLAR